MLIITDLNNNAHALLATVEHNIELNGNEDINITIHKQQSTIDLKTISYLHTITWHGNDYKIINLEKITFGDSYYLEIVAIPLFYYHFQKSVIDDNYDGSHTAAEAFRIIFENSGYTPILVDFSGALKLEGFGKGATRMEMFQQAVERYQYEFEIKGSQVYLKHRIGSDTNFLYKYKLNATDIKQTIDASNYFVTINGFADFEEGTEDYKNKAKIKRTYTHPIADILGEFKPQGRSYTNGAIKTVETLDAALKKAVEDSLEISVEASLYDIRKMGYKDAVPYRGDRVFLIDERFDFKQEIRVFSVKSIYDASDELVKCDVTFGSMSQADKYKGRINDLSKAFSDLIEGRKKLPIISLEKIGMDMIKSIHDASSDIIFGPFGMKAISKNDPNRVFGLNSEGWYISQDGGRNPKTIATADGIYADALFAGTLWLTNDLNIESEDGYLNLTGSKFTMKSKVNSNNAVTITPEGMTLYGYDGRALFINNINKNELMANIQIFDTTFDGVNVYTDETEYKSVYVIRDRFRGNFLELTGTARLVGADSTDANYIDIAVTRFGLDNPEPYFYKRERVTNSSDPEDYSFKMMIDMKSIFNAIVDYRRFDWYVKIKLVQSNGLKTSFRLNRGEWID